MLLLALVLLAVPADLPASQPHLSERARAADPLTRAEALYELFLAQLRSEPMSSEYSMLLYEHTVEESLRLLGPPSEVRVLTYGGVTWLEHAYWLPASPAALTKAGIAAPQLRFYGPRVLFRNGRSVPSSVFGDEYHLKYVEAYPRYLAFTIIAPAPTPGSR